MEGGVSSSNCDYFQCVCACDLTAAMCDYNCCCDPDCTSAEISRFEDNNACAFEGYSLATQELCYSSTQLYKVNPASPLSGTPTSKQALGEALCVEKVNAASGGYYYTDTAVQSSTIFTESAGQKDYDYIEESTTTSSTDAYYDQGDGIAAFKYDGSSTYYSTSSGYFSLPAADFSGECNDHNYVTFEDNIAPRQCMRKLDNTDTTNFVAQCTSLFSVNNFADRIFVGATADVLGASNTGTNYASSVVQVEIGSVQHVMLNNSIESNITLAWIVNGCDTTSYANQAAYMAGGNCRFGKATSVYGLPLAEVDVFPSNPVCANMVKEVHYTVYHDSTAAATINKVVADIVLTDVPYMPVFDTDQDYSIKSIYNNTNPYDQILQQKYSVKFASSYTGTCSDSNGNCVHRARSGNPGYLMGLPVLYGPVQAADASVGLQTVEMYKEGLKAPSPIIDFDETTPSAHGSGSCPKLYGNLASQPILFGYDQFTSCTLTLTRAELEGLCCSSSDCSTSETTDYADSSGSPFFFTNVTAGYVGLWGNSDPLDISQWTSFAIRTASTTRAWDSTTGICTGMPTGVNYKFLVVSAAEKSFPQNKIVSAEVEYTTADLTSK
jgi:hypothetical protein